MIEGKLQTVAHSTLDWLNEQPWFQEAQNRWDELNETTRQGIRLGLVFGCLLFVGIWSLRFTMNLKSMRANIIAKKDLIYQLQSLDQDVQGFSDFSEDSNLTEGKGFQKTDWSEVLTSLANQAHIKPEALKVEVDKESPIETENSVESFYSVGLTKVTIRNIVSLAYEIESYSKPIRIRKMEVDTGSDPSGYMNAKLLISGFDTK